MYNDSKKIARLTEIINNAMLPTLQIKESLNQTTFHLDLRGKAGLETILRQFFNKNLIPSIENEVFEILTESSFTLKFRYSGNEDWKVYFDDTDEKAVLKFFELDQNFCNDCFQFTDRNYNENAGEVTCLKCFNENEREAESERKQEIHESNYGRI